MVAEGGPQFAGVPAGAEPLDRGRPEPERATRSSMEFLIGCLRPLVDRPIVDRTGLKASEYEFRSNLREASAEAKGGARLALLQWVKAPLDMLVIDHLERPTEN